LSPVPERLISVIKDMYEGSKAAVRIPHGMTKNMDITLGVHQGSALIPFLFVLKPDCIVNHLEEGPLRTILYADDIALVAHSREEPEKRAQLWQGALAANGLRLNVSKTKFISSEQCTEAILDCQGKVIEKVEQFRYLRSDLSEEGSVEHAVRRRITAAWLKWREPTEILCDPPRKRWKDVIKKDLAEIGAAPDDALDRMRWRRITRTADPASAWD
uniref:Reverse transcriptase domain-containing protein n=1 Tax=Heligmosomoides polygyrus TaxID=6339 RepID=A0A183GV88_HELPZ